MDLMQAICNASQCAAEDTPSIHPLLERNSLSFVDCARVMWRPREGSTIPMYLPGHEGDGDSDHGRFSWSFRRTINTGIPHTRLRNRICLSVSHKSLLSVIDPSLMKRHGFNKLIVDGGGAGEYDSHDANRKLNWIESEVLRTSNSRTG